MYYMAHRLTELDQSHRRTCDELSLKHFKLRSPRPIHWTRHRLPSHYHLPILNSMNFNQGYHDLTQANHSDHSDHLLQSRNMANMSAPASAGTDNMNWSGYGDQGRNSMTGNSVRAPMIQERI